MYKWILEKKNLTKLNIIVSEYWTNYLWVSKVLAFTYFIQYSLTMLNIQFLSILTYTWFALVKWITQNEIGKNNWYSLNGEKVLYLNIHLYMIQPIILGNIFNAFFKAS